MPVKPAPVLALVSPVSVASTYSLILAAVVPPSWVATAKTHLFLGNTAEARQPRRAPLVWSHISSCNPSVPTTWHTHSCVGVALSFHLPQIVEFSDNVLTLTQAPQEKAAAALVQ